MYLSRVPARHWGGVPKHRLLDRLHPRARPGADHGRSQLRQNIRYQVGRLSFMRNFAQGNVAVFF